MGLTRIAITRPVFILMLMLAAILMGFLSYNSTRKELNPDVSFPVVTVSTVYPGASPDEVNTLVSERIEDAVSGVTNLRELSSTSQEGFSTVVAQFELGTNVDVALNDVRTRVEAILNELPDDAERPTVVKFDNSAEPVLYLAFSSATRNSQELRDLLDQKLQDRYAQITGVADAAVMGGDIREIQINLDKDKLLSYGIGITDIARQVQAMNMNIPGGRIESGDREYSVRVKAQWENVEQVRNSIINIQDPDNPQAKARKVRLSDVATVEDTVQRRNTYSRLNGSDTVVLGIQKAKEGNAVEITAAADQLTAEILKQYKDLKIEKTLEQAKIIRESLADLNFTLFFGIFLVSAVVYLFLHNFRGMLIVAIAIPVCLFVTLAAIRLAGFTINNMTMLALILAIGVLVDDAIVVLENIYRHLKMGENPRDAALNGRGEIGLAAIAITLADVVVFLPIAFMGGIVGQFFKPMALSYVFAVLTSLFVSFTVTPMLAARWYRAGEDLEHPTGRFARAFERSFGAVERGYGRVLEWALNHRWFVFILGNIALVAIFIFIGGAFAGLSPQGPMSALQVGIPLLVISTAVGALVFVINLFRRIVKPKLILNGFLFGLIFPVFALLGGFFGAWKQGAPFQMEFIPASDGGNVAIEVEMPPGASLAATQKVVEQVEKAVQGHPDVKYVLSNVGTQGGGWSGSSQGSNYAQVSATLYDKGALLDRMPWAKHEERLRWNSDKWVAAELLQRVGRIPGADIRVSAANSQGFGSPIQMSFQSEDRQLLVRTVENIKNRLQNGAVKGVINADTSSATGKPEFQYVPDRNRLADAGVNVQEFGFALRAMYTGDDTARFRAGNGEEYKIRVQLSDEDRNNPNIVSEMPITFEQGSPIFVNSVAEQRVEPSVDQIQRRDRQQEVQLTADLLPGYAQGSVQAQVESWIKENNLLPAGVEIAPLGASQAQARESGFMMLAFMLGLILVYMLLASLYDNLLYPFIIQLAQPQAMTGAILALVLTDKPFSLVGFIGLITLVGLVGKNAILLVDYTNTLRGRGKSRHDALVEAGPVRLRPIVMTTLALVLGTLPIAMAIGRGSEFRETIGIVIIGGITLSTLLTLVVIPCSYTIFDDLSIALGKLMKRRPQELPPEAFSDVDREAETKPPANV